MTTASVLRLIFLSAIWGASFLFIRIGVAELAPPLLIFVRVSLASVFLFLVGVYLRKSFDAQANWRHYLVLGFFNSALPFLLFSFAAKTISASLLSILNATAPIWGAAIGAVWTRRLLPPKAVIGLLLGVVGVALLAGVETRSLPPAGGIAIAAALGAAFSYALATTYAKSAKTVEPFANAYGSMWAASLLIAPALFFSPIPATVPGMGVVAAVVALGVLCSGVAYLLYFRLIADVGATSALTVTFLIPVFGVLWGRVFLQETVGWHTFVGAAIVLAGTALATGFSITAVFLPKKDHPT
jgi:drug/metabolite transporter (DMT)-like permease